MVRLGLLKLVVCFLAFAATTVPASMLSAQELTVKYAAHDFKGSPKFTVRAFKNGSFRAVWRSKTITAEGGLDTTRFGTDSNRLKWQNVSFQIPPNLGIDYFTIKFLNDECCGATRGGKKYGDRNFFVQKITFNGKNYSASRGKQKTCKDDRDKAGEMFCAGTLEIAVKNNTDPDTNAQAVSNASLAKSVCGYNFSGGKSASYLKSIQRGLAKRNLYNGGIDGKFGKGSCSALTKWAKCENVGSKVLSDGALSKLTKTEPSARELSCYGDRPAKTTQPVILSVNSSDDYRTEKGRHTIINVKMRNRWGNRAEFKLNGYVTGTKPHEVCLVYGNRNSDNKCFEVYDSNNTIKQTIAKFNKRDKENITDACALIVTQFNEIRGKTKNSNSRKLVDQRKSAFTGFAYKCLVAIQSSFPGTRYAAAAAGVGAPKQEGSSTPDQVTSGASCTQSKLQVRFNQNVLKSLDLYTSTVDGISGPNYRKAVAGGEKLLGQWADENKNCLSVSERKILEAVVAARKIGSQCKFLPNSAMIENAFTTLSAAGLAKRNSIDHQGANGVIWMLNTSSEFEKQLMQRFWYGNNTWGASSRDCRLDAAELSELVIINSKPIADAEGNTETKPDTIDAAEVPKEQETVILNANMISMSAVKRAGSATVSLVVDGSDLETSIVSKSIFGLNNQIKMDVKFDMSGGSPILDFVISEDDTKINLHFFDQEVQSRGFAAGLKELTLGKTPNDQSAFRIRMLDNGKSNIDNGDFRKLLAKMPNKDHAMISALCGHVAGVSTSSEGFEAQFTNPEDKATFRSSLFSNPQVRSAVNKLAAQCVTEVRTTGAIEASFKISAPPIVCTAAENDGLASLDTQIADEQDSLLGVKDEINQLQSQRPLFQFKECAAYADNSESAAKSLEVLQEKVLQAQLDTKDATSRLDAGRLLATRLADLKAPADICLVENKTLREDVNEFVFELDPVFVGIQCPGLDDAPKNPVQIVINEINAEILALLEVHISEDEIAALEAERDNKLQEFRELAARLAAIEQSKASPEQVQEQTDTNASLRQTIDDIEARIVSLENEIRDLNGILANNAGMIEDIDALNQRLVQLSAQKDNRQSALDETKSTSLGALAVISQRDLEISKLEDQISNLKIQMEAASSTSSTLVEEVVQLGQDIADTTQRVTTLEANVSEAQALIDNANGAIGQKSQEVSNLDAELSKKVAEATILSNSVTTLAPQADAAETTVEGMRASLETDYVPIAQFQEKATRLNELTQAVTERTKLIQELRMDLGSIEQEEQLLIKMCVADAQCKAAMGERLGVDQ